MRHLCRALVGLSALLFLLGVDGAGGQTADDHGDTIGAATPLPLGSSVEGRLDTGEDLDVFRLDLTTESSDTDVWIYADGGLDTVGELLASDGSVIVSNDDGFISGRYRAFHIRWTLSPRVYYIRVSSYSGGTGDRPTGDYGLHAQAVTQYPGGGDIATATPLGCAWSAVDGDNLEYPIAGLDGDAQYEVQVRAINKAGAGRWSRGFTAAAAPSPCSAAGAVANPSDSPGLASDCRTLLEARESLDQEGTLDWEAGTPISAWEGVRVEGTPMRVVGLSLRDEGLNGEISAQLGNLARLEVLDLAQNGLTGGIPSQLARLVNLVELDLAHNTLTGEIPAALGNLATLTELDLGQNRLAGVIPEELRRLSSLVRLSLDGNELGGEIRPGSAVYPA